MWFKNECTKISDRLWDYSAQRLSASETAQVESHLQHCAKCQAEAEAYRQTCGMLGAARSLPVPASQTTWRDLRPSLTPPRRLAFRSADFLPRLTLAGAGTALAATLLVVFMSGGHHSPTTGNPSNGTSDHQVTARGPVTPPAANADSHIGTAPSDSETASANPILGAFLNNRASDLAQDSNSETKVTAPPAPRAPVRHHNSSRFVRNEGRGSRSKAPAVAADANQEGDNASPRAQQNYVLNPVSPSNEEETAHHYVISSISVSQNGGAVASSDGTDEGRAW